MIVKSLFGKTANAENVYKYDLISNLSKVSILTFGATIQSFIVPSKKGSVDVVLGYDDVSSYERFDSYLGATVGRNCNRIKNSQFYIDGKLICLNSNDNSNNLHGGIVGFSHRIWDVLEVDETNNSITLSLYSKDGEENFPANLEVKTKYTLNGSSLTIEYFGLSDGKTVCNLTNHSYFCMDGEGAPTAHDAYFKINSNSVTEVNSELIPTGNIVSVEGTPFDFRNFKKINKDILSTNEQVKFMNGYDCNFCLENDKNYQEVAWVYSENSGVSLTVSTNMPGLQLYSGYFLTDRIGKGGKLYKNNRSICLEAQTYPDAVNNKNFPTSIIDKGELYYAKTTYEFSIIKD